MAIYGVVLYHGERRDRRPSVADGFGVIDGNVYTFYESDGTAYSTPFSDPPGAPLGVWWQDVPESGTPDEAHEAARIWMGKWLG